MKYKILTITTTIVLFFCTLTGFAQDFWKIINTPPGVSVSPIAINSNKDIFFGTGGGVYRSMDEGISWELIGLESKTVYSLAINELGYIYAGCNIASSGHSIYRSMDNGQSWEGIYGGFANVICIKSYPGGLMFASSGTGNYLSVIRSFDYGNTCERKSHQKYSRLARTHRIFTGGDGKTALGTHRQPAAWRHFYQRYRSFSARNHQNTQFQYCTLL